MSWTLDIIHLDVKTDGDATLILIRNDEDDDDDRNILIDGGMGDAMPEIVRGVNRYSSDRKWIDTVIVTHYHADHVGGIAKMAGARHKYFEGTEYIDRGAAQLAMTDQRPLRARGSTPVDSYVWLTGSRAPEGNSYFAETRDQRAHEIHKVLSRPPGLWSKIVRETDLEPDDLDDIKIADDDVLERLGVKSRALGSKRNLKAVKKMLITAGYDAALEIALNDTQPATQNEIKDHLVSYRKFGRYLCDTKSDLLDKVAACYDDQGYSYDPPEILETEVIWGDSGPPRRAPTLTCITENRYILQEYTQDDDDVDYEVNNDPNAAAENAKSLGFVLNFNRFRYFIGGDLEHTQELQIGEGLIDDLDVLKLSHHGSQKSSFHDFLKNTDPVVAIVSNSDKNTHAFPDSGTQDRLKNHTPGLVHFFMTGAPKVWQRTHKAVVMGNGQDEDGDVWVHVKESDSRKDPARFWIKGDKSDTASWRGANFLNRVTTAFSKRYQRGMTVPYGATDERDIIETRADYVAVAASGSSSSRTKRARVRPNNNGNKRQRKTIPRDDSEVEKAYPMKFASDDDNDDDFFDYDDDDT